MTLPFTGFQKLPLICIIPCISLQVGKKKEKPNRNLFLSFQSKDSENYKLPWGCLFHFICTAVKDAVQPTFFLSFFFFFSFVGLSQAWQLFVCMCLCVCTMRLSRCVSLMGLWTKRRRKKEEDSKGSRNCHTLLPTLQRLSTLISLLFPFSISVSSSLLLPSFHYSSFSL